MFQFKNTGLGIKEPDTSSALPNNYGKVRTFREDLENSGKNGPAGPSREEGINLPQNIASVEKRIPDENILQNREAPQAMPDTAREQSAPANPFQSVPMPPPVSLPDSGLPAFKSTPSQSFFAEKPSLTENILPKHREGQLPPQKSKGKLVLVVVIALIAAALGAGFYFYWFYAKNTSPAVSSVPAEQAVPIPSPAEQTTASKNEKLRSLIVDTAQGPAEIKNAVQKFATEFAVSASENDLLEIKILGKDSQPIGKKDFFAGFGATIPEAVMMKLSEDYSLFSRKEESTVKSGIVFKTVTSSGLAEEMKNWEPKMPADLGSLYLGQTTVPGDSAFNQSRYKSADIRYFNFSSPSATSLDYSIVSNFLIIGTSKDSVRAIMDYMAEK